MEGCPTCSRLSRFSRKLVFGRASTTISRCLYRATGFLSDHSKRLEILLNLSSWKGQGNQHLSDTHTLLLNKFNVVDHHLLVVTREFERQDEPLTAEDFCATWQVMQAMPTGGLAFFNRGPKSGASQPHKHVQIVPLPLSPEGPTEPPLAGAIKSCSRGKGALEVFEVRNLPYESYTCGLDPLSGCQPLVEVYSRLLSLLESKDRAESHNIIMTNNWMWMIPRRLNSSGPCSVNALGYAGTLFVRSQEEIDYIKANGPMRVLTDGGFQWD